MGKKGKKIVFIVLDVLVLGFFGFYLSLNLRYKAEEPGDGDFIARALFANGTSNGTTPSSNTVTWCPTGKYVNYNKTGCVCYEASISMGSCGKISVGENAVNCNAISSTSHSKSTTCSSSSSYIKVDNSGNVTVGSVPKSLCTVSATITCTAHHDSDDCSDASGTMSVTAMVPWSSGTKNVYTSVPDLNQAKAEKEGNDVYYNDCNPNDKDSYGRTKCTKHSRGCGTHVEPQPHCYKDSDGFLRYGYYESVSRDGKLVVSSPANKWTIVDVPESECYTQFKCSTKYPGKDEKEATCNSISEFEGAYLKKCGIKVGDSIGDEFYRIDCKETMKAGFNGPILNDANHPNSFMYPGTAFKFNYLAKTKIECEGKWHQDFYEKAENYVKSYIDKKKINAFHQEDSGFFGSALSGVHSVRDSYKNWTLNYFNSSMSKETGEIKDIQPTVKNTSKDEKQFTLELSDGSTAAVSTCGSEPNGRNANFTYKVAYTIKMQMPVVYYSDSKKPQYTTTASTGYTSLGRVFPISDIKEYANRKDYKYTVTVSNLGLGHKWVNKETCVLGVKEKEIVFRSINLNDPFIQYLDSNHQIGENWKNNKYDFTGIIDKNTWSNPSQFNKVTINQQIGALIKNELASQYASYLGSCAKGTDQGKTPQLCALYKQAVAGKK